MIRFTVRILPKYRKGRENTMSRMVIALGGNALGNNPEAQIEKVRYAAKAIVPLILAGNDVIVCHGNGPQVGMINLAFEKGYEGGYTPLMPLAECTAMSQGYIGYHLQQAIDAELVAQGCNDCLLYTSRFKNAGVVGKCINRPKNEQYRKRDKEADDRAVGADQRNGNALYDQEGNQPKNCDHNKANKNVVAQQGFRTQHGCDHIRKRGAHGHHTKAHLYPNQPCSHKTPARGHRFADPNGRPSIYRHCRGELRGHKGNGDYEHKHRKDHERYGFPACVGNVWDAAYRSKISHC